MTPLRLSEHPVPGCDQSENVSRLHDGELAPGLEAALRDHLRACPPCRAELAAYRSLSAAFDAADRPRLSDRSRRRILDNVTTPAWVRLVLPVARPFAAVAALLLATGLPVLVLTQSSVSAHASEMPQSWEITAATQDADGNRLVPQSQLADWVVQDLSSGRK